MKENEEETIQEQQRRNMDGTQGGCRARCSQEAPRGQPRGTEDGVGPRLRALGPQPGQEVPSGPVFGGGGWEGLMETGSEQETSTGQR